MNKKPKCNFVNKSNYLYLQYLSISKFSKVRGEKPSYAKMYEVDSQYENM